jgi:alpha-ketoglutarate-dependent taurine dioxygenase
VSVTATRLKPEIGVEIAGLHGHVFVDRSVAVQCQALLDQHGVVVYREANVADDDLVAFSRLLGTVHERPSSEDSGYPEISIVSLDPGLSTCGCRKRVRVADGQRRPLVSRCVVGSGRVEADALAVGWSLSGWFRPLGGTR